MLRGPRDIRTYRERRLPAELKRSINKLQAVEFDKALD
jgi:hypothetical protein